MTITEKELTESLVARLTEDRRDAHDHIVTMQAELSEARNQLAYTIEDMNKLMKELQRLEKQNAALLAACKEALDRWGDYAPPSNSKAYAAMVQVRQAIALAEAPAESQVQEPTR